MAFAITYAGRKVGFGTVYALHGPYVFEKSYSELRLVFDVVVVASSYAELKALSNALESSFSKRATAGEKLVIDLAGNSWTYNQGTTMLAAEARIIKSGNQDTDKGFSRAYTVSITAELPATDDAGLRDVEVVVDLTPSRQKFVTMRGTYTATSSGNAVARYQADFDAEAAAFLTAIDSAATFELVEENYSYDRHQSGSTPAPNLCNFTRQYVELLANQSSSNLDDTQMRDHRIVFTDLSQHPGDSAESISRLRRVVGTFECAIDVDQTTNVQAVYDSKVKRHVRDLFRTNFRPQVFAVEDERVSYDETSKRMSVALQYIYQSQKSEAIVELAQSVTYREARTIDYTPTHTPDELAAHVDVGFATLERVWNRTVIAVGEDQPRRRISEKKGSGDAGAFDDNIGGEEGPDSRDGSKIQKAGWNVIENTSQITPQWIGDPDFDEQIQVFVLTETVVERYNTEPGQRSTTPITPR